ncbi:9478_t:CDS:1 [Paraglomus occultum]|uniref:9478_t:CDS:1 n=1 Tax=Paraglomus occultum TaxID=144539 RepID=A0A9N9B4M9_9GLOM|nr:9478_t:CDS:1 [Paraglomus occultum]
MSNDISTFLSTILSEEQELQFAAFDSSNALELGLLIVKNAKQKGYPVVIQITINNFLLFHYAMFGTTPVDVETASSVGAIVSKYHHSSAYVNINVENGLSGGGFPLTIKGTVIGSIVVAGAVAKDDYELVVGTLKEYLGMEKEGKNKVE